MAAASIRGNWPAPPPSVEVTALRRELEKEQQQSAHYAQLAATAVTALELLLMGIMDVQQGAEWEKARAVMRLTAIAQNLANDLAELAPTFSDLIAACASMAAAQSAAGIRMYDTRLGNQEHTTKQLIEDVADLKTRFDDFNERLGSLTTQVNRLAASQSGEGSG